MLHSRTSTRGTSAVRRLVQLGSAGRDPSNGDVAWKADAGAASSTTSPIIFIFSELRHCCVLPPRYFTKHDIPTDWQRFGQETSESIAKQMPQTIDVTEVAFLASESFGFAFKPYASVFPVSDPLEGLEVEKENDLDAIAENS